MKKKRTRLFATLIAAALSLMLLVSCAGGAASTTATSLPPSDCDGAHIDLNSNGYCDSCNEYLIVVIDFYTINDLHGQMFDTDNQPGVDEMTSYFANAELTDDHTVILASGDMWQGSAESNLTRGEMMTEWLNGIGTVSMTLGNHEFDWGEEYISSNLALAEFPFLAINIYDTETGERVEYAQPSVSIERGNAKIGIIGAIGDCYSSISADKVADVEFKVGDELTELVKAEAERLRADGCDLIVYSIHDGLARSGGGTATSSALSSFYDIMLSDGYVDLVFEAHTHYDYVLRDEKGVYHVQGGGYNTALSHVEVSLNYVTDSVVVNKAETVSSGEYGKLEPDPVIDELADKYADSIARGDELLGRADRYVRGETLQQICADMYLELGLELWGDEYDIALGGGYIGIRSPKHLEAGEIYYRDIYSLFPFDNNICLCSISGNNLLRRFINSNHSSYFIAVSPELDPNSIDKNATYYVIVDTYSAYYAPNGLTIIDVYGEQIFARDLIAEYIKAGGPLS